MEKHWLAVLHDLEGRGPAGTLLLTDVDIPKVAEHPPPSYGKGHLLFLRGFMSPAWIAALGSKYGIDPEFFCRHLDFFASSVHRKCFNLPSLASTNNNIIHVYVNTIISNRDSSLSDTDASNLRRAIPEQLSKYKRQLQNSARYGDSLVREYSILDHEYSFIEQRISICITKNGDGWLGEYSTPSSGYIACTNDGVGLVWMDNGRSLDESLPGPWKGDQCRKTTVFPIVQHHDKMTTRNLDDMKPNLKGMSQDPQSTALPQATSELPLKYMPLLSMVDSSGSSNLDPLHALIPVFAHAAFSEVAVLNLMADLIEQLMAPVSLSDSRADVFETLQYYDRLLQRHTEQLRHCVRAIRRLIEKYEARPAHVQLSPDHSARSPVRNHSWRSETKRTLPDQDMSQDSHVSSPSSTFSYSGILDDYDDLLERCTRLSSLVTSAMNTEMNRAMILESRRGIEQTERMKKLTMLATYFIPLSFTASLFGMNFAVLGQGDLPMWWYVVLAVPLTLVIAGIYSWDVKASR